MSGNRSLKNRRMRSLLGVALVSILLGIGNLLFGQFKYAQYSILLSEATAELASPESSASLPLLGPALNIDKQTQHINRLKGRLDFYSIVILGGQIFIAIGSICLLGGFLARRRADPSTEETAPPQP